MYGRRQILGYEAPYTILEHSPTKNNTVLRSTSSIILLPYSTTQIHNQFTRTTVPILSLTHHHPLTYQSHPTITTSQTTITPKTTSDDSISICMHSGRPILFSSFLRVLGFFDDAPSTTSAQLFGSVFFSVPFFCCSFVWEKSVRRRGSVVNKKEEWSGLGYRPMRSKTKQTFSKPLAAITFTI